MVVGETGTEPLAAPPVSKPVPTQLVALVPVHVSVDVPPSAIAGGVAPRVAVTLPPTVTMACAMGLLAPPLPLHVTPYAVLVVGDTSIWPLTAPPVEKPMPVQLVAFTPLHSRLLEPPSAIAAGVAVSEAEMAGPTVIVKSVESLAPPDPVQSSA